MRWGLFLLTWLGFMVFSPLHAADPWVVYEGTEGPGKGKHIVFVTGDEEYRSEEGMPQMAKILATHHGFRCTVLFAIDPKDGTINPNILNNIPGLEALKTADLMVLFTRMRDLPDEQMKRISDYVDTGKPIIALRTSTHAFANKTSKTYQKWSFQSREKGWEGGFGKQLLGETWVSHHGNHKSEATRGIVAKEAMDHPILKGIQDGDIFGPTDVYGIRLPLPGDSKPLIMGQVLVGMKPDDKPVEGKKNNPMMPVAWIKSYEANGNKTKIFTTTMGSADDLLSEGLRRLLVNACYWTLGMEEKIPASSKVDLVGEYKPTGYGFNTYKKGIKPEDLIDKK